MASSDLNVDIAENVRFRELIDTCGVDDEELLLLVLLLLVLEEEELLHAAAARHKASDADAIAAPFLATRIMSTTSRMKNASRGRIQACVLILGPG